MDLKIVVAGRNLDIKTPFLYLLFVGIQMRKMMPKVDTKRHPRQTSGRTRGRQKEYWEKAEKEGSERQ